MKKNVKMISVTALITVILTLILENLNTQQKNIEYVIQNLAPVSDPRFQITLENLLGPPFAENNLITAYQNGDEIFPPMLEAIRHAEKTINFESYIYLSGKIGDQFVSALSERARSGVKVHLLLDGVGSGKIKKSMIEEMRAAGVQVEWYHPLAWYTLTRINNRTHRKILVVDGKIAFTGGVGISDEWLGKAQDEAHWRDSHFRIEGPGVGQMQAAFTDNWLTVSPEVLHDSSYFIRGKPRGHAKIQVFESSPREGAGSAQLLYLMSLAAARQSIFLSMAYFVPGDLAMKEILSARSRGVNGQIIVPREHADSKAVRYASRHLYGPLLAAGVKIYEFQPTMFHCKLLVIDQAWTSVGSTNFDDRSFRLNSEANLNVLDPEFAQSQIKVFQDDLLRSREVTLEEWKRSSWAEKIAGYGANFLKSQTERAPKWGRIGAARNFCMPI